MTQTEMSNQEQSLRVDILTRTKTAVRKKTGRGEYPNLCSSTTARWSGLYRYIEGRAALYSEACIISVDYFGEVTGFRYANRQTSAPLDMPEHLVKPVHDGLRKLSALMCDPAFQIKFLLEPGDMMIFDNQRVIQGRTHYDDTSGARHLRTMETSREEFHNRLRLLMIKLNRPEPRNLKLARGALA